MKKFTHMGDKGSARMVDISGKEKTLREATASARVKVSGEVIKVMNLEGLPKGNPFETARIAGIMAAKNAGSMIPLCHQIPISECDMEIEVDERRNSISIVSSVRAEWKTGVEMEAMVAVAAAALTVYDMVKAIDRSAVIGDIKLLTKKGGKSGSYKREDD